MMQPIVKNEEQELDNIAEQIWMNWVCNYGSRFHVFRCNKYLSLFSVMHHMPVINELTLIIIMASSDYKLALINMISYCSLAWDISFAQSRRWCLVTGKEDKIKWKRGGRIHADPTWKVIKIMCLTNLNLQDWREIQLPCTGPKTTPKSIWAIKFSDNWKQPKPKHRENLNRYQIYKW